MKHEIVRPFRKLARNLIESVTGCRLERFGGRTFALIDEKCRSEAWFSYDAQIRTIIDNLKVDLVIDVGANEGQFARRLRSFYHGKIISFEPVSSVFKRLSEWAASDPDWSVYKMALGNQESE